VPTEPAANRSGSLRERKKQHTRRALIEASQRLFLSQGYAATTLEQVAAEVEVHQTTLLRYFPTKQDLALALEQQAFEHFEAGITDPERRESAVDSYFSFNLELAGEWQRDPGRLNYLFFLDSEPSIVAHETAILRRYEEVLASEIAKDAGVDSDFDYYSQVLAAMLANSMHALIRSWRKAPEEIDLVVGLEALLRFVHEQFPTRREARNLRMAVLAEGSAG
jgi:AcrR family transcriptional regulator